MAEEKSVKLYGMWASPYVLRVKLALKIKGIEFEYIEEDLGNKSEELLKYNPVHKSVPVLVNNGLAIAESFVILEYIDEIWTQSPPLIPKNPYQRAKHRFWATYFQEVSETLGKALKLSTQGKATEQLMNEYFKKLDLAEELIKDILPNGVPSFKDNLKPGYLDIVLYSFFGTSDVAEEFLGVKPLTAARYPQLTSWIKALSEVPQVKEVTPPKHKFLELLHGMRQQN